ncbi:MAG: SAM-dependent methyltransferase, partial [Terriglobales bacterium]
RLKGGDPMIFGRVGEEYAALRRAGIAVEIVPGISAASGAAAAAGIPLTLRGVAQSVRFTTGHDTLQAQPGETLAVYMGLERLERLAEELMAQGWPPETEVAVIERATLPGSRRVQAPLNEIAARARQAKLRPPAMILAGAVVGWRRQLESGHERPLSSLSAEPPPPALILLAHGSPLPGWQSEVNALAGSLAIPGQFVGAAYLPPVQPSLTAAVARAAAAGAERVVVVPYFLAAGLHVTRDLPKLVEMARDAFPQLEIRLAECLQGHPALRAAILARAGEAALCWENGREVYASG